MAKKHLKELLRDGQVVMPGIYDCISGRAVELAGYPAAYLTSAGVSYSWCGVPDMGLISPDEMLWFAGRIADYITIPLIVSIENGYGDTGASVFRTVERMARAGASAVMLDDTGGRRGYDRGTDISLAELSVWKQKVKAAKQAAGEDCMVIARTMARIAGAGVEEGVKRCRAAVEAGADMTSLVGLKDAAEAAEMSAKVPGLKMWTNLTTRDGKPEMECGKLEELGFRLISVHYTEKGAMFGMLDYAKQNQRNQNTVYHDTHDFDGLLEPGEDYHKLFGFHRIWIPMEKEFLDVREASAIPDTVKKAGEIDG